MESAAGLFDVLALAARSTLIVLAFLSLLSLVPRFWPSRHQPPTRQT